MNRFLSIIELKARQYLWKVVAVLAVLAAGELVWFALMLKNVPGWSLYRAGTVYGVVFAVMLTAVAALLGGVRAGKANSELRLRMLKTSPWGVYLTEVLFSLICLLFAWAVQAAVVLLSARMLTGAEGYALGSQSPLLQIASHKGLFETVPLGIPKAWTGTVLCVLSLAQASAYMKTLSRRQCFALSSWLVIVVCDIFFIVTYKGEARIIDYPIYLASPIAAAVFALISMLLARSELRRQREEKDDGE